MFKSALVFLLIGATLAVPSKNVGIIYGQPAEPGQFPYIAAVKHYDTYQYISCAGSIINKSWVITAAHSIRRQPISNLQIIVGTNLLSTGGTKYNVSYYVMHPDYDDLKLTNDIGLIKIDGEFEFNDLVQPIAIGNTEGNEAALVAGWGGAEDVTMYPDNLRYTQVTALTDEECQKKEAEYNIQGMFHYGPEQVCALGSDRSGPCGGDDGGPLVVDGKLVGIVSYEFGIPCWPGVPYVYTRPSAYLEWINQNIQE